MKKRELENMTPEEKKAMRMAAAKIMGEKIVYEEELKKSKEEAEEVEENPE
jgi:hypothetical protein